MNRAIGSMNYKDAFYLSVLVISVISLVMSFECRRLTAHPALTAAQGGSSSTGTPTATPVLEAPLAPVQLTPERMQTIGVKLATVEMQNVKDEIRASGNVEVNERQVAYVQTRFPGWIRQ